MINPRAIPSRGRPGPGGTRRGFALVLVLILIAAASVLGASYAASAGLRLNGSDNFCRLTRARHLAESGVHHGIYLLQYDQAAVLASSAESPLGPFQVDESDDTYVVYLDGTPAADEYVLRARGVCGGVRQEASVRVFCRNEYRQRMIELGPTCYWRLNETAGYDARDLMGRHHGRYERYVAQGQDGVLLGDADPAARFDGIDDHVDTGAWDVTGNELTLLGWFNAEDFYRNDARIVSKATGTSDSEHYFMLSTVRQSGRICLRLRVRAGGSTRRLHADEGDIQPGEWVFAAGVYDGSKMVLYQDGREVGRCSKTGSLNTNSGVDVWIGGNPPRDTDRPWKGRLDEIAVFDRALSASEIQTLYAARWPTVRVLAWNE